MKGLSEFKAETEKFEREVDAEAARLVKLGVYPWDAIEKAKSTVALRRAEKD